MSSLSRVILSTGKKSEKMDLTLTGPVMPQGDRQIRERPGGPNMHIKEAMT
jgi:hypothetical protein